VKVAEKLPCGLCAEVAGFCLLFLYCLFACQGPRSTATDSIDQRSYRLGGIGAFEEMVGAGVKKLALSAAMPKAEMDALFDEAKAIAERNGAEIYLEAEFLVTDLFPAEITEGMQVLLIYRGRTLQDYMDLKERKRRLVEGGSYEGGAREEIARDQAGRGESVVGLGGRTCGRGQGGTTT